MNSLLIIFFCILITFLVSRFIAFASLKWKILPVSILSNGKRYHHFVWGNFFIVVTAFCVFGLGFNPNNVYLIIFFGLGLGMVLDEFPHWVGDIKELTRNVSFLPKSVLAVVFIELLILLLFILKYLRII
jgi:hypothetical protein